jgi:hypothetical protein
VWLGVDEVPAHQALLEADRGFPPSPPTPDVWAAIGQRDTPVEGSLVLQTLRDTLTREVGNLGDTIHLGKRTLRVVGKRDDDADQPPVLVVEDVASEARGPGTRNS